MSVKTDPGHYTNTHTHATHAQSPEAAMTIYNTPDDLIGPPSLNHLSHTHASEHTWRKANAERRRGLSDLSVSFFNKKIKPQTPV